MFNKKLKEQLEDAESLIGMLDSFIFVAKTDRKNCQAVAFADAELKQYKAKWKSHDK